MNTTNFQGLITAFAQAKLDFVVIGGVAALAHGSSIATFDLDICYSRSRENIHRMCETLATYHPYLRNAPKGLPFVFDSETVLLGLNFTLETDAGDLDLLGEVQPIGFYNSVVARSQPAELYGFTVNVLSLSALIAAKRFAGRGKDLAVLPELEALLEMQDLDKRD